MRNAMRNIITPRIIMQCLSTYNNVLGMSPREGLIEVSYALVRPNDERRVRIMLSNDTGVWEVVSWNEHLNIHKLADLMQRLKVQQEVTHAA